MRGDNHWQEREEDLAMEEEQFDLPLKEDEKKSDREFLKGIAFGLMLSGIAALALLLFRFGTFGRRQSGEGAGVLTSRATYQKLEDIRDLIEDHELYDTDPDELERYLFKGAAAGIEDPYAAYYSEQELEEINRQNEGTYYGIGATFARDADGRTVVIDLLKDSPAMQAGLQNGDILLEVNGEDVTGISFEDAMDRITEGEDGSVSLTVLRGSEEQKMSISFADLLLAEVEYSILEDDIGYIRIPEFDIVTVDQFKTAMEELKKEGAQKLVLDVRDNPGGLLTSVCRILDELLGEGLIVSTQTREGEGEKIWSDAQHCYDGPVAVLVNGQSASAAEVFAAALQDYGMGPLIGTTTYGKGVVQKTYLLRDGSAFKLTTEKYYTAEGRDIDGNGVEPDIVEENEEKVLERALEELRKK